MKLADIKALDPKRVIVLDTETTGVKPEGNDEILSLTIIDLEGTVLFDELVKPEHRKTWAKAQEINGISPAMVKDKQPLAAYSDQLHELWSRIDLIVGYNTEFDMAFINNSELPSLPYVQQFDVMREYAEMVGAWDKKHNDYRWVKLATCARHYGITDFDAHSSLGDTEATRQCFIALINDPEYIADRERRDAPAKFAYITDMATEQKPKKRLGCLTAFIAFIGITAAYGAIFYKGENPMGRVIDVFAAAVCFAIYWFIIKPKRGE